MKQNCVFCHVDRVIILPKLEDFFKIQLSIVDFKMLNNTSNLSLDIGEKFQNGQA